MPASGADASRADASRVSDATVTTVTLPTPSARAAHLKEELAKVEQAGGEGLMLRQPASRYETGVRSKTLLKAGSAVESVRARAESAASPHLHPRRLGAAAQLWRQSQFGAKAHIDVASATACCALGRGAAERARLLPTIANRR